MTDLTAGRLLTRQFLRRFLENDLLSPSGDGHESATFVLAFLTVAGLWASFPLIAKSNNPFVSPFGTLVSALNDKFVGLAGSMIVMGLGAVIEWDALGLDRRDWAILGPLPIVQRAIIRAKLEALALFVTVFAAGMNAVPSVVYPLVQNIKLPFGMLGTVWLVTTHLSVCLAACGFGFLVPLALRETLWALFGPRVFRAMSAVIQFVTVFCLVTALLLVVTSRPRVSEALERGDGAAYLLPPMWFVGLYETMTGPIVRDLPLQSPWHRQYWTPAQNQHDRMRYVALAPAFAQLAGRGLLSLVVLGLLGLGALAVGRRRVTPPGLSESAVHRALRRGASWWAARCVVRHPVSQAGFFFTLQTLWRSSTHRAYLAGYLALGLAVAVVSTGSFGTARASEATPSVRLLACQMILSFFLLGGLRNVFAIPAGLRENWVFRLSWDEDWRAYLAGVRRATAMGVLLPLLLLLVPFHVFLWGSRTAVLHLLFGLLSSLALAEALLLNFSKLPFTCSYSPKGTFKTRWPWYFLGFLLCTFGLARLEQLALATRTGCAVLGGVLCAALAVIAAYRGWLLHRGQSPVFDDPPEQPTLRLGLMGGD